MVFPTDRASASSQDTTLGQTKSKHSLGQLVFELVEQSAQFSAGDTGVTRYFLTRHHRHLLDWLQGLAHDWQFQCSVDEFGNARFTKPASKPNAGTVMLASHQDTVASASPFSSLVGVLLALVAFKDSSQLAVGIEIVALGDEQGVRFNTALNSSTALAGQFDIDTLRSIDDKGTRLSEALKTFGLNAQKIPQVALNRDKYLAFVEIGVDLNHTLNSLQLPLALVGSVTGIERFEVEVYCPQVAPQQDALSRASEIISWVNQLCNKTSQLEGVVGKLIVTPNAVNIPPNNVMLAVELRSPSQQVQAEAKTQLFGFLQSFGNVSYRCVYSQPGVDSDEKLSEVLAEAVSDAGLTPHVIFSNVAHACLQLAGVVPCATLLVRSYNTPRLQVSVKDMALALASLQNFGRLMAARQSQINKVIL